MKVIRLGYIDGLIRMDRVVFFVKQIKKQAHLLDRSEKRPAHTVILEYFDMKE